MMTLLELDPIFQVGKDTHNLVKPYAYGLLAVTGAINLAVDIAKLSVPGSEGNRTYWVALTKWFGFFLLLHFTGDICTDIRSYAAGIASSIGTQSVTQFLSQLKTELLREVPVDGLTAASSWKMITGGVSFVILLGSSLVAILAITIFQLAQAVLFSTLTAIGPLAVAAAILPGAQGVLSGWIRYLIEIASWNIVAAIILKMLLASNIASFQSTGTDWISLLVANVAFCALLCIVPTLSSRLVGSGFGGIAPSVHSVAKTIAGKPNAPQ